MCVYAGLQGRISEVYPAARRRGCLAALSAPKRQGSLPRHTTAAAVAAAAAGGGGGGAAETRGSYKGRRGRRGGGVRGLAFDDDGVHEGFGALARDTSNAFERGIHIVLRSEMSDSKVMGSDRGAAERA